MNTKKIAENDNDTYSMFDECTNSIEEERATLREEFYNRLNEETNAFKEQSKIMEEEVATLSDKYSNLNEETTSLKIENKELKEILEELNRRMEAQITSLINESSKNIDKINQELREAKNEIKVMKCHSFSKRYNTTHISKDHCR